MARNEQIKALENAIEYLECEDWGNIPDEERTITTKDIKALNELLDSLTK